MFGNYPDLDKRIIKTDSSGKKEVLASSVKEALPELKERFNLLLSKFAISRNSNLIFF